MAIRRDFCLLWQLTRWVGVALMSLYIVTLIFFIAVNHFRHTRRQMFTLDCSICLEHPCLIFCFTFRVFINVHWVHNRKLLIECRCHYWIIAAISCYEAKSMIHHWVHRPLRVKNFWLFIDTWVEIVFPWLFILQYLSHKFCIPCLETLILHKSIEVFKIVVVQI